MRKLRAFASQEDVEEATINLTPLIDVVFVVLIMFILIAPLLEQERVSLASACHREDKSPSSVHQASSLTIHVGADNLILLNQKPVALENLTSLLKQEKKRAPLIIPQLFHDQKAFFGTYQNVKNALELAGYEEVDLVLKP